LTKRALEVLNLFDIKPLRPLMLAIAQKFPDKEAEGVAVPGLAQRAAHGGQQHENGHR
jgi:hypothetical protein